MVTRLASFLTKIWRSEQGAVAIQMALISTLLLGMTALATDVGYAYYMHRQMQSAADTAAFSAALAKQAGFPASFNTEAYAVAGQVGFVNGANGVTVTINNPPTNPPASGAYAANSPAVQVIVRQPQTLPLIGAVCSLLGGTCSGEVTLGAQAVASTGATPICMLALSTTGAAFQLNGSVTVGNPGCGIADNSASNPATNIKGGSSTIRGQFTSQGPQNTNGNNASFPDAKPKTGVTVTDPYIANGQNAWVLAQATSPSKPASNCSSPNFSSGSKSGGATYCNVTGGHSAMVSTMLIRSVVR